MLVRILVFFLSAILVTPLAAVTPLPEGPGLAAKYPQDEGVSKDPAVIYADGFEGYADAGGLSSNWNAGTYHHLRLSSEPGAFNSGKQALEFTCPKQETELSNVAARGLGGEALVFFRYYSKFDTSFDVVGSSHNGAGVSASYFDKGRATPGIKADGRNKIWVSLEAWRGEAGEKKPGRQNLYVYHPEQRSEWGDHFFPTGVVLPFTYKPGDFGPDFQARPDVVPELGRWYCFELMVKLNQPGRRDGRIAWWVDGKLAADHPGLRLRDTRSLKIDRMDLSFHIGRNAARETKKWYDDVVVARSYVGPMAGGGQAR